MEYLEWEINAFDKNTHYLAQIAMEVRRSYVKRPASVKFGDFVMKFVRKGEEGEGLSLHTKARTNRTKQFFFGLTGLIGTAGKKRKKRK
jgi:hypothetical protein